VLLLREPLLLSLLGREGSRCCWLSEIGGEKGIEVGGRRFEEVG